MKIAGIAVDDWKLPVFKKHLDAAGYRYNLHPGITEGTSLLQVECEFVSSLQRVVEAAQEECETMKEKK